MNNVYEILLNRIKFYYPNYDKSPELLELLIDAVGLPDVVGEDLWEFQLFPSLDGESELSFKAVKCGIWADKWIVDAHYKAFKLRCLSIQYSENGVPLSRLKALYPNYNYIE